MHCEQAYCPGARSINYFTIHDASIYQDHSITCLWLTYEITNSFRERLKNL